MIEYSILKLFVDDSTLYDKYYGTLKLDFIRDNYPVLFRCFKCLPATSIEGLEANYLANYPVLKDGDRQVIRTLLESVKQTETDSKEIVTYLESHLTREWSSAVGITALEVAEGRKSMEDLQTLLDKKESIEVEEDEIEFVTTDIELLITEEEVTGGLHWRLKCLNQSLGCLRKGNFGHIFARVETGKTAMWVSEATFMATQVTNPILIFFNEEGGRDVIFRMYNAITGMTYMEITNNPKKAKAIWDAKIGDKIKFIDQPSQVERKSMERIIEKVNPDLIIVDNMDKVKGFSGDREDMRLHEIYKWGREIAKTQCPFISVGQADATGHNSEYLDESQMANSKTGKPSELDFIIGIGRIDKVGHENARYINTPKNKLRGDANSIEAMRHLRGRQVNLKPMLSIYEDM
jgi:replicative DNA helicase